MAPTPANELEEKMEFWYSSAKWKDVLRTDGVETICVPPCLDVLKQWKRDDIDEAAYLKRYIVGQCGEAEFLRKFTELKLGGILVFGLNTYDLEVSRTVPKKLFDKKGEWDAIFFHQNRGIFVIEVKATETNDENTVKERLEKAKAQLDKNIKNIKKSFHTLYHKDCIAITGLICFPFRNEKSKICDGFRVVDKSAINDGAMLKKFFEPQTNGTIMEVSLLQRFTVEFVFCRSKVEFHSQAYNAMQVATWIMEQDIKQKQDLTKVSMPGNGPSGKIILTAQQLEAVKCRRKCVTIRGAPGSGKTLIVMLRALRAAKKNKPGSVFVFVNEKLKAKYEHYFFEEAEKIFVDEANNIDRTPQVHTVDKLQFVQPEDDVFFDETPVEEFYIDKIKSRSCSRGSTTVVFTGLYKPGEAVALFRLHQRQLNDFKHFELTKVLRGTENIFEIWEHYFPHGTKIGHSIKGVPVKNLALATFEEVQAMLLAKITTLTQTNINAPSLTRQHIAVITSDELDSTKMRGYFGINGISCGQVNEQARKSKKAKTLAVDVYLNTPSYEWPIVFIVMKSGDKKEEILPISASRCIASLTIVEYKIDAHHRSKPNLTQTIGKVEKQDDILSVPSRSHQSPATLSPAASPKTVKVPCPENAALVGRLVEAKDVLSPRIEKALQLIDRGHYYKPIHRSTAYSTDKAYRSENVHISAPNVYAAVLEKLQLSSGHSFLNIGSGTGYLNTVAGLLLGRLGENHGIEVHADVVEYADQRLREMVAILPTRDAADFALPKFVTGNGLLLDPALMGTYDRMYCSASVAPRYHRFVCSFVRIGGVCVLPSDNKLQKITRTGVDLWDIENVLDVSFADLIEPSTDATSSSVSLLIRELRTTSVQSAACQENDNLVDSLPIHSPRIEKAMRLIDRGHYYMPSDRSMAYVNKAYRSKESEHVHISAPGIYVAVLEILQLSSGHSFLNIGSGTGYLSTVAGLLLGSSGVNHGIEVHADMVEYANQHLREMVASLPASDAGDFAMPKFVTSNGLLLDPAVMGTYDRMYCNASVAPRYHRLVCSFVRIGGVCVLPSGNKLQKIIRTSTDSYDIENTLNVAFMDLIEPSTDSTSSSASVLLREHRLKTMLHFVRGSEMRSSAKDGVASTGQRDLPSLQKLL